MRTVIVALTSLAILACTNDPTGTTTKLVPGAIAIVPGAATKGAKAYTPDTIRVSRAGSGNIVWHNRDSTLHTMTGTFFENFPVPVPVGDSLVITIQSTGFPGSYEYHCEIHPTMVGRVIITP